MTRWIAFIILALGTLLIATPRTIAQSKDPTLAVHFPFGEATRAGSWIPLIVSVSDPQSRTLELEIKVATGSPIGANIQVPITTYGALTRYTVYVPTTVGYGFPDITLQLRDPLTGRRLGDRLVAAPPVNNWNQGLSLAIVTPTGSEQFLLDTLRQATFSTQAGVLTPGDLPLDQIGYDGIDVLILYGVDLNKVDFQVQRSIVAWVQGGGKLIVWPGDSILGDTPITRILPADVGPIEAIDVSSLNNNFLASNGNPSVLARKLALRPGAEAIEFQSKFPTFPQRSHGLGRVGVMPFDVFDIRTRNSGTDAILVFDALNGIVEFESQHSSSNKLSPVNLVDSDEIYGARKSIFGTLANVADLKMFDVRILLWMMLALTILVGPVDWFVLRALRRQPWTWFTTLGWATLATIGATLLALSGRSGSSTFRSFTLIDQLNGQTYEKSQLACIFSSNSREFEIIQDLPQWWRIPWDGTFSHRRTSGSLVDFRQNANANLMQPFTVKQANLLVMESKSFGDDGLKIQSNLTTNNGSVTGTITNSSRWPIKSIDVISSSGVLSVDRIILPDESINLSEFKSRGIEYLWDRWPENAITTRQLIVNNRIQDESRNLVIMMIRFDNYDGPKLTDNTSIQQHHSAVLRDFIQLHPDRLP